MRYLVMECHFSYAVVLDEEGRFLSVANCNYEVGQTVDNVVEMRCEPPESTDDLVLKHGASAPAKKKGPRKWLAGLAAAACFAAAAFGVSLMAGEPYASVYLSINPEVRIDVDREDDVVGLAGVNDDGAGLVAGYDHGGKQLDLVVDDLVDRAIEMGYLHEGGTVSLVFDAESDQWVAATSERLEAHLGDHLSERMAVTIEVGGGTHAKTDFSSVEGDYGESEEPLSTTIRIDDDDDDDDADASVEDSRQDSPVPSGSNDDGQRDYEDEPIRDETDLPLAYGDSGYGTGSGDSDDSDDDSSEGGSSNYGDSGYE